MKIYPSIEHKHFTIYHQPRKLLYKFYLKILSCFPKEPFYVLETSFLSFGSTKLWANLNFATTTTYRQAFQHPSFYAYTVVSFTTLTEVWFNLTYISTIVSIFDIFGVNHYPIISFTPACFAYAFYSLYLFPFKTSLVIQVVWTSFVQFHQISFIYSARDGLREHTTSCYRQKNERNMITITTQKVIIYRHIKTAFLINQNI